jgi:hypothetical protein
VSLFSVRALLAVDVARLGIMIVTVTVVMISVYGVFFLHLVL